MHFYVLDEIIELCRLESINTFVIGRGGATLEKVVWKACQGRLAGRVCIVPWRAFREIHDIKDIYVIFSNFIALKFALYLRFLILTT